MRSLRLAMLALALAGSAVLAAAPARADRDDWHRGWHGDRDWHDHDGWRRPWGVAVAPPPVYYAPPPVYYAPPPVYYPPPPPPVIYTPGFNIGIGVR